MLSVMGLENDKPKSAAATARFAELLRQFRLALGLSQEELAERARLSVNAVGLLERGARNVPRRATVDALANALELENAKREEFEASVRRARTMEASDAEPARLTNIPAQASSFLGREGELAAIESLLGTNRLVTITGPGGIGKTKIALEIAKRTMHGYPDGIWFIDLASLRDNDGLAREIAMTLNVLHDSQISLLRAIQTHVAHRDFLMIFDNCEHILDAAADTIFHIMEAAPKGRIIATSRELLKITGEVVYRLPALRIPNDGTALGRARTYDAVRLFVERAAASKPGFTLTAANLALVNTICRRLDGIALAIELAAARVGTIGLGNIGDHLETHLPHWRGDRNVPERQQTLFATISWSYELLTDDERTVFRRLGTFAGSWTARCAESTCSDDRLSPQHVIRALSALIEKSLVATESEQAFLRYRLLESTKLFARQKLAKSGEEPTIRTKHAQWMATIAEDARTSASSMPRNLWLERYRPELEDARAAIDWSQGAGNHPMLASRIISGLKDVWLSLQLDDELLARALAAIDATDPHDEHALALLFRAVIRADANLTGSSAALAHRAERIFESTGDLQGLANLHCGMALELTYRGDHVRAQAACDLGLSYFRQAGADRSFAYIAYLVNYGLRELELDRPESARAALYDALRLGRANKDLYLVASATAALSVLFFYQGHAYRSIELTQRLLAKRWFLANSHEEAVMYVDMAAYRIGANDRLGSLRSARFAVARTRGRFEYNFFAALHHLAAALALNGMGTKAARVLGFLTALGLRNQFLGTFVERRSLALLLVLLREQLSEEQIATSKSIGERLDEDELLDQAAPNATGGRTDFRHFRDLLREDLPEAPPQ